MRHSKTAVKQGQDAAAAWGQSHPPWTASCRPWLGAHPNSHTSQLWDGVRLSSPRARTSPPTGAPQAGRAVAEWISGQFGASEVMERLPTVTLPCGQKQDISLVRISSVHEAGLNPAVTASPHAREAIVKTAHWLLFLIIFFPHIYCLDTFKPFHWCALHSGSHLYISSCYGWNILMYC